jgi:hypothetical protein
MHVLKPASNTSPSAQQSCVSLRGLYVPASGHPLKVGKHKVRAGEATVAGGHVLQEVIDSFRNVPGTQALQRCVRFVMSCPSKPELQVQFAEISLLTALGGQDAHAELPACGEYLPLVQGKQKEPLLIPGPAVPTGQQVLDSISLSEHSKKKESVS